MEFRNPAYNARGTIDCEINHPRFGWIPHTIPADENPELQVAAVAASPAPYAPPAPADLLAEWRASADMEKGEFVVGLMRLGVLPRNEAKAAARGVWPATFAAALATLPAGIDPDEAEIIWAATTRVRRMHPILLALIPMSNLTDADIDAMFGWVAE